ncbi:MAG: hypothetical protein M3282_01775 [Gemmatimonadota bacterium]|nr:hypothetical protein [Gemmatimonadota bacterium]
MAGSQVDGAGMAKLKTLEEAAAGLQRVHSLVERYALTLKQGGNTSQFVHQIRRALEPLVGLLKPQFGVLSDQVASVNLVATRGGSEQMRVRGLREGVASLRQGFEIAERKVREQHGTEQRGPSVEG